MALKQLTFAKDVDDLDTLYLPDDSIVFSSTREPKYCGCNRHIMANLHRMEADGANMRPIGKGALFEGHSSLTPDGRILCDRWEYVDRNVGDAQGLLTSPGGADIFGRVVSLQGRVNMPPVVTVAASDSRPAVNPATPREQRADPVQLRRRR